MWHTATLAPAQSIAVRVVPMPSTAGLAMIKAQGGIFGWVTTSGAVIETLPGAA